MKIEGTFESEIIGHTQKPAGWVGHGAVHVDAAGLTLEGNVRGNGLISLLAFVGFALGIAGGLTIDVDDTQWAAYGGLGLMFAGGALGAAMSKAKSLRTEVAWKSIKKVQLRGNTFAFVSRVAPKGQVRFVLGTPSEAEGLRQALSDANVKVES